MESFELIWQNLNFIYVRGTIESYLRLRGKRVNFDITITEIQQKVWERRRKRGERKCWISVMWIPKFLCPVMKCAWSAQSEKKKKKFVTIVAMPLSKMGENK